MAWRAEARGGDQEELSGPAEGLKGWLDKRGDGRFETCIPGKMVNFYNKLQGLKRKESSNWTGLDPVQSYLSFYSLSLSKN